MPYKILVVDDHPDAARIASVLFKALGHDAHPETTGKRALAAVESFTPDIAILDIGLPDISGYDIARALRDRFGPTLFLVAMTGWGQPEDLVRAQAAGFDRHVLKPADAAILMDLLAEAYRRGR